MRKTLTIILVVLVGLLFLCLSKALAQALSASTGITSSGRTAVMLTAECKSHLVYFKSIKQDIYVPESYISEVEHHESLVGYGYKPHDRFTMLFGVGWCQDYVVYANEFESLVIMPGLKMNSCEAGFRYDLFEFNRIDLTLTGLMSTYSGLSTMIGITWKFENCR